MRIIHISDPHFTAGDNDAPMDDWAGFDWSKVDLTDTSTWANLSPLRPWNADSLDRSTTLSNYLIANKEMLNANTIVITGDLVDSGDDSAAYDRATAFIGLLKANGFAVYSVPGNHDYSHWGELAWASEDNRKRFHLVPGTSGDETKYPWVVSMGRDTLILLDSLKAELDDSQWGAMCVHPLGIDDYHMPLDASHIAGCLGPDFAAPLAAVAIAGGDQLAQGRLGPAQLSALNTLLISHQSQRAIGCRVIVCLHHNPFSTDSKGWLDDSADFLSIINGKVDALLFGHATPDGFYRQDGSVPSDAPSTTPSDWETKWQVPLISCVNLQHGGPKGYTPSKPAYPITVVDTDQTQLEVYFTDQTGPYVRRGLMAATVTGVVIDGQIGAPVAGAEIDVYVPPALVPVASGTTDDRGVYTIGLTETGSYSISAASQFYGVASADFSVAWGGVANENFVLTLTGGVLSGTVSEVRTGAPIPGVEIDLCDLYGTATPIASATTNALGYFRILFDYPKIWAIDVFARANNYSEGMAQPSLTGANTVLNFTLTATAPGTITGSVTDDQGAAVADAEVFASGGYYSTTVQATTGSDGSYRLNINAGGVNLSVSRPGYVATTVQNIELVAGSTITENLVLVKRMPGNIAGTVLDPNGNLVPGAEVTADTVSGTTESNGTYLLANVLSGPVSVQATFGAESCAETVTVIANQTVTANLKLVAPPTCTGAGRPGNPCVGIGRPDNPRPCKGTTVY